MISLAGNNALCLYLLMFCAAIMHAQPRLWLKAVNEDGVPLQQVAAGKPWILELHIEGSRAASPSPIIGGLDGFDVYKQGVQMHMINGVATSKHTYRVTIGHPGTYHIGPAEMKEQDTIIQSPVLTIKAGEQQVQDAQALRMQKKASTAKRALLHVSAHKERVVIGEPIQFFVQFLYRTKDISLQSIQVPEFADFFVSQKTGPKTGKKTVDSIEYEYLEWDWHIIPQKIGPLKIPVLGADFVLPPDDNFFSGFPGLLRTFMDKKRIYSDPLIIQVDPLPRHTPPVNIVGEFKALRLSIDNSVIREGEAAIVTLELEGAGNIALLDALPLQEIPEGLKAYPSKAYILDAPEGSKTSKKRFEYIVQAVKRGSWEIPVQSITYFDTVTRTHKKLSTESLAVQIIAQRSTSSVNSLPKEYASDSQVPSTHEQPLEARVESDVLAPLCTDFAYYEQNSYMVPWWLFFIGVLIPCIGIMYRFIYRIFPQHVRLRGFWGGADPIYAQARKMLLQAEREQNIAHVYELFVMLVAHASGISRQEVTEQKIQKFLRKHGCSDQECFEWQEFFNRISAHVFAHDHYTYDDYTVLFQKARFWIKRLERCK
jgi:oxygen tolerance protein BatD